MGHSIDAAHHILSSVSDSVALPHRTVHPWNLLGELSGDELSGDE
jgi:hypothetical protein